MTRKLTFAYPGDLKLKTGGYGYDREVIAGLEALGWLVEPLSLGDGFPAPSQPVKLEAERRLSTLPDDALVVIDGLAFGVLENWAAHEAARLKIIALVHHPLALETGLDPNSQRQLWESERKALSFARHIIVTSPMTARELIANFEVSGQNVTIALPGTKPAAVSACIGEPRHIVSIGTLTPRKAHHVLIEALKQIEDLPWRATIAGSKRFAPENVKMLERQIEALGLGDRVMLVGECDDARALLAEADIFALASRYEGYGMVFAEALSQGLPIVACNAGAIPDVVPKEAGFLVSVDDTRAFADALRQLLENKALHKRMAEAARHAGERLPRWEKTAQNISKILDAQQ